MERIYYRFPQNIDFERRYGYNSDLRYLLKVMASIHGKSGAIDFDTRARTSSATWTRCGRAGTSPSRCPKANGLPAAHAA